MVKSIRRRIYLPTSRGLWLIGLALALAFAAYIYLRRSYLHSQPITPEFLAYLYNKGLAWSGLTFMLLAVVVGPLARLIPPATTLIRYRKNTGAIGFYLASAHLILSLLLIPTRFPIGSYLSNPISFLSAIAAILALAFIAHHSRTISVNQLGYAKWKAIQRLIYLVLALAIIHILTLGPLPFWQRWLANPIGLPPLGLVVTLLAVLTLLLRLIVIPLGMPGRHHHD